mmetsp:Transcript_21407/g.21739  ORF Transcript_21407/g.21739 Transcript_21407/m.21739 type:complete len:89 (+) Transcript_21407:357-623(+)
MQTSTVFHVKNVLKMPMKPRQTLDVCYWFFQFKVQEVLLQKHIAHETSIILVDRVHISALFIFLWVYLTYLKVHMFQISNTHGDNGLA